jgi:hypothetical protein
MCVRRRPELFGWRRLAGAFVASSVENDFVIFDAEIFRGHLFHSIEALLEFEDAAADAA